MNRPQRYTTETDLTLPVLKQQSDHWLLDGQYRHLSPGTLANRRFVLEKLLWHLQRAEAAACGTSEIRAFLAYLNTGHQEDEGRWGSGQTKAVRPRTSKSYYGILQTFFRFCIAEGVIDADPMERLRPPVAREDQIQPFTTEQVLALLGAAKKSRYPKRDLAIVRLLFDTGCRASELCGIKIKDLNMQARSVEVTGKGNKKRTIHFGQKCGRALWTYLREAEEREPEGSLFLGERGHSPGRAMTRSGLLQLIERLGQVAKIEGVRCSPHTYRHTFAVAYLRDGGQEFSLMHILGHTTLNQTRKYVAFARADIAAQHRLHAPGDRLKERGE